MSPLGVSTVADDELLARYIMHRSHVRANTTVKPAVFIPYKYVELSVTRHAGLTEPDIWKYGEHVAKHQDKHLYGRADIRAAACREQRLDVHAAPLSNNPNHANITGWPADKPSQKIIATELAKQAGYLTSPG